MLDISDFSREFYYTTNLRTGSHETQDSGLRSDDDNGCQCGTAPTLDNGDGSNPANGEMSACHCSRSIPPGRKCHRMEARRRAEYCNRCEGSSCAGFSILFRQAAAVAEKHGSSEGWIQTVKSLAALKADTYAPGHGDLQTKADIQTRLANVGARREKIKQLVAKQILGRRPASPGRN